jgi:hypothetical protein
MGSINAAMAKALPGTAVMVRTGAYVERVDILSRGSPGSTRPYPIGAKLISACRSSELVEVMSQRAAPDPCWPDSHLTALSSISWG